MTKDTVPVNFPTESLILPSKRRFFPLHIPNFHQQLRHYISTADPDKIYVAADRAVYSIDIPSRSRKIIAVLPFEPRCMGAGFGWIAVGGPDNGECAFIKIADPETNVGSRSRDVDSVLPIDLEATTRAPPATSAADDAGMGRHNRAGRLPEVQHHKFGGSIVNSVTVHRFPGDGKTIANEDIVVLSNNDHSITIYSLTRAKVLTIIDHDSCMNYAVVSPDSNVLAAVGDEDNAYFYEISRDYDNCTLTANGEKLTGWHWFILRQSQMNIVKGPDDPCCFTIAFSPSSHICAIGAQSGDIHVFDVTTLRASYSYNATSIDDPIICHFQSSRPYLSGGAVRCMAFSPEPWDVLVWLEDRGRAGIADLRCGFARRQILDFGTTEPGAPEISTEELVFEDYGSSFHDSELQSFEDFVYEMETRQRFMIDVLGRSAQRATTDGRGASSTERDSESPHRRGLREALLRDPDLTERERLIIDFLNTARLGTDSARRSINPELRSDLAEPRSRLQEAAEGARRASRSTSPLPYTTIRDWLRAGYGPVGMHSRNTNAGETGASSDLQETDVAPRHRTGDASTTAVGAQPSITISWESTPYELQLAAVEATRSARRTAGLQAERADQNSESATQGTSSRDTLYRHRVENSSSSSRRTDRQESRSDFPRIRESELRTNVAAERLRRQRQAVLDTHSPLSQWEQRYRRQLMGSEQARSPRWARSLLNDGIDRLGSSHRELDPLRTAGLGWSANGRALYIATVNGIFEFHLNINDRKTFPIQSYR